MTTKDDALDDATRERLKELAAPPKFDWPVLRPVPAAAMVGWLRRGIADLRAAPLASLFFGVVLTGMGLLLTRYFGGAVGIALNTGFLLVGPFLAVGLYEISRRLEQGKPVVFVETLVAWRCNFPAIGFFALILMLSLAVWMRVAVVVTALFVPQDAQSLGEFLAAATESQQNFGFLLAFTAVGGALALFAFAISVVSLPMLLDRDRMDAISAMITSFGTLTRSPLAMLLWAASIAALTLIGFLTAFIGLVVVLPVIGHASWHAYRALVEPAAVADSDTG